MNTNEITQEQISALADGELSSAYVDMALAALRHNEGRATWDIYHQIGDIMRSDDMALNLSPDFTSRMLARLDGEPAMIAAPLAVVPVAAEQIVVNGRSAATGTRSMRRFALPSLAAAAAVAAVAFITVPQMMSVNNRPATPAMLSAAQMTLASTSNVNVGYGTQMVASAADTEVLRDPRIDEYLSEHQRFSPSLYSTAQYARSATFAIDADK